MAFRIKYLAVLLLFAIFVLLIVNEYLQLRYGQSLYVSLNTSNALTPGELNWLQRRGSLKYGETYDALPPRQQDGLEQRQGYSIDLIAMMSVDMKVPISFIMLKWEDMFDALDDGTIDFTNLSYSPERAQKYLLSKPLYKTKGVVLAKDDGENKLTEIRQLHGMTIAAIRNDYVVEALTERVPDARIHLCEDLVECIRLLEEGRVQAVAGDEMNIMYAVQKDALYQGYYTLDEPARTA